MFVKDSVLLEMFNDYLNSNNDAIYIEDERFDPSDVLMTMDSKTYENEFDNWLDRSCESGLLTYDEDSGCYTLND
jgi:hypothetical protein